MKVFTQLAWLIIGLLLGGLIAYSANTLAVDPIVTESTNTNTNTNNSTSTSTSDNTNRNFNTNNSTNYNYNNSNNTNRNYNTNNNTSYNYDQSSVKSDSTVRTDGSMVTTIKSPPPSAIAPSFSAGHGNDLCTVGASGAVQTQILGISVGSTFTEENCLRLKNAKTLYDMGMKVAAVSVMCQDPKVFDAMMMAGTPCPYDGKIGQEAKLAWQAHTIDEPKEENLDDVESKRLKALGIVGSIVGGFLLF